MKKSNKKSTSKVLTISYYVLLVGLLTFQVVKTVYAGSLFVTSHYQAQKLETKQTQLLAQKQQLEQQLASKTALSQLADSDSIYQPIEKVITIQTDLSLASR
jgi:sensor histidine kinase regulating citrate/malate metabolism